MGIYLRKLTAGHVLDRRLMHVYYDVYAENSCVRAMSGNASNLNNLY
jgi:hypothetical protein